MSRPKGSKNKPKRVLSTPTAPTKVEPTADGFERSGVVNQVENISPAGVPPPVEEVSK